jgi:hypothetical protein
MSFFGFHLVLSLRFSLEAENREASYLATDNVMMEFIGLSKTINGTIRMMSHAISHVYSLLYFFFHPLLNGTYQWPFRRGTFCGVLSLSCFSYDVSGV